MQFIQVYYKKIHSIKDWIEQEEWVLQVAQELYEDTEVYKKFSFPTVEEENPIKSFILWKINDLSLLGQAEIIRKLLYNRAKNLKIPTPVVIINLDTSETIEITIYELIIDTLEEIDNLVDSYFKYTKNETHKTFKPIIKDTIKNKIMNKIS